MFLSRLDLHGFKSFAQKTTVDFAPGVTAIVGPNGCGKSNVIDAVRWVLGEQRARLLRSDKMEGVLFNGAEGKRPLGMAEVSLTVENTRGVLPTEFSAVTVTRRLFRNGDSEYLLNGTQCRLRDVQDLFLDTGLGAGAYSVIELSMVEDILSENAADRRRLFEEAAGVTRYKRRREGALKRLAATEADLTRLDDILEEVEKQVRSLSRQAQKAQKAARLGARLRLLELALAAHDYAALDAERAALDAGARTRRDAAEAFAAQNARGEAQLEAARTALVGMETQMGDAVRALHAHTEAVARLDGERRVAEERVAADARARARLSADAGADAARAAMLDQAESEIAIRLVATAAAAAASTAALATATTARDQAAADADAARRARDAARTAEATAAAAARAAETARDRTADRRALLAQDAVRLAADRDALADAGVEEDGSRSEQGASAATAALVAADAARADARAALDAARTAAEAARATASDAGSARDAARAEAALLRALVESGDGGGDALAALAEAGLPATTVADLVACDDADRLALDAALGPLAEAVVVDTAEAADQAVEAVRAAGAGRAAFVVADALAEPAERSPVPPGTRPAADLARPADARAARVVAALLANVFVVNGAPGAALADARRLAARFPVARFVTPDGLWTGGGILRGGSRGASGRLGLAERQATAADRRARAETQLAAALAARDAAVAAVETARAEASRADDARDRAVSEQSAARQALARQQAEANAREQQRTRLDARAGETARALAALPDAAALARDAEIALTASAAASAARAGAEAAFERADTDRRATEAAHADARLAHARAASEQATVQADAARLADERRILDARAATRAEESERLAQHATDAGATRADAEARLDAMRGETDTLRAAAEAAETVVLEARVTIADAEKALRGVRSQRDAEAEAVATAERRLAEIAVRQEGLVQRLSDDHAADLDAADEAFDRLTAEELFQPDTARAEIPHVREQVRRLGAVNALALDDYETESERLAFLTAQRADLAGAETSLRETIREINQAARERFDATFTEIQTAFARLFRDLFGGDAEAAVTLDGDDPLEAPVAITARPRGKRPVSITQLSGGEKTLTATALLFAIYLVKPSPFCILDEVDAPLDDANVGRFMTLVRQFADTTQFILVTHNKLTMEAADRMYGVTMPTPGVSRLVGVRLDDVETAEAAPAP